MSDLIRVESLDDLHVCEHPSSWYSKALRADGHLLGCQSAILKFKARSICEVLGYQLAAALGVPVPRMQGIWTSHAGRFGSGKEYKAHRIGILIEELPNLVERTFIGDIVLEQVDTIGRDIVVRFLALCTFAGNEWGEFVSTSNGHRYFIDLEDVLNTLEPTEDLMTVSSRARRSAFARSRKAYACWHRPSIDAMFREADRLGLSALVRSQLCELCSLPRPDRARFVSVTGHPLAREISELAAILLESRVAVVASDLGVPHS